MSLSFIFRSLRLKTLIRWGIPIATLIFLALTLYKNWQEVSTVNWRNSAWLYGGAALGLSLIAHVWSALVWTEILREFQHSVPWFQGTIIFLRSYPAKYLPPGNVWHLYRRVLDIHKIGVALEAATLSVLLEPILIAAAALAIALLGGASYPAIQGLSLVAILLGVHPRTLNPVLHWISQRRKQPSAKTRLQRYPLRSLFGETLFMGLRGVSFLLTASAFTPLTWEILGPLLGGFSFAWFLSLVVPGAPGGLGVFEATAVALLETTLAPGFLLSTVALYRLMSIIAEIMGAALGWFVSRSREV